MRLQRIERTIRENDALDLAIMWHDGVIGSSQARRWRDFHRTWLRIKDYPTVTEFPHEPTKQYKISVCTVAMNRLKDVQGALLHNMGDTEYPNVEFILVDYGSTDGLSEWVRENMMEHIESGLLTFYRVPDATYFTHGHSKNIALKLGTGDLLMNLDADNTVWHGFVERINRMANHVEGPFVIVQEGKTHGNITLRRKDFYSVNGYDEDLQGRAPIAYNLQLRVLHELGATLMFYPKGHRGFVKNQYPYAVNMNPKLKKYKHWHDQNIFKTYFNVMLGKKTNQEWGKATVVKNWDKVFEI